jgi:hypothetical protein
MQDGDVGFQPGSKPGNLSPQPVVAMLMMLLSVGPDGVAVSLGC